MNIREMLKTIIVPVHREGYGTIVSMAVAVAVLSLLSNLLALMALVALGLCTYFFRDPERVIPEGKDVITAPADGVVDRVEITDPPEELGLDKDSGWTRISIFLNVFNVHVQRIPFDGEIVKLHYRKGTFLNISMDKNSKDNERQCCLLKAKNGFEIALVQIAGLIARRIVCDLVVGQKVKRGDRYGIIKFGSRVDIYLPGGTTVYAKAGQTMIAGETVLGRLP
ncbi:MAG: phosphatidylserine decarboxylase [Rickettsiales bacterium]|jgi:phosphatidylserine decarboxylase|nr:phosphatidylserine decarboxylase [Rickettsiales bacterium]